MKKYGLIFKYLKDYKLGIVSYFVCTLLSIVFGIMSLAMLFPFLQVLFKIGNSVPTTGTKVIKFTPFEVLKEKLGAIINSGDSVHALAIICMLMIGSIILKNTFLK